MQALCCWQCCGQVGLRGELGQKRLGTSPFTQFSQPFLPWRAFGDSPTILILAAVVWNHSKQVVVVVDAYDILVACTCKYFLHHLLSHAGRWECSGPNPALSVSFLSFSFPSVFLNSQLRPTLPGNSYWLNEGSPSVKAAWLKLFEGPLLSLCFPSGLMNLLSCSSRVR